MTNSIIVLLLVKCNQSGLSFCRCFLCGSLCSSFSLCLFSGESGSLFCYFLCFSLVRLFLCFEKFCLSIFLALGICLTQHLESLYFICFPSVKFLLCGSLVESTFLNTSTQMFHHINTFAFENVTGCVCRLCACLYPIESTLEIQIYCCGIGIGVVSTNLLCKFTITWCSYISDNDAVEGIAFASATL